MITVMRSQTAADMRDALFLLRDQLADAAPNVADDSAAMGCCGCGAWMCDVVTAPSDGYPHGEGYCWRCVDRHELVVYRVLPGRERGGEAAS